MYIILDTETTSLHPGQIGQLSYIIADENYAPITAKNFFFTVDSMSPGAEQVHGFSRQKLYELSNGRRFADHIEEIYNDVQHNILVAHNATFDLKFLKAEYERCNRTCKPKDVQCSMKYFTNICCIPANTARGGYKRPKVAELLQYFRIEEKKVDAVTQEIFEGGSVGFHDARYDTVAVMLALQSHKHSDRTSSPVVDKETVVSDLNISFSISDEELENMTPEQLIQHAIQQEKNLSITYLKTGNVKSCRVISPEKIGNIRYFGRLVYGVQAFCHERKAKRVFSLEKIVKVEVV